MPRSTTKKLTPKGKSGTKNGDTKTGKAKTNDAKTKKELRIDIPVAIVCLFGPFGFQMLGFPNITLLGIFSWIICLVMIGRIIWVLMKGFKQKPRILCSVAAPAVAAILLLGPVIRQARHHESKTISENQSTALKEVEQFLNGQDEYHLEELFGLPSLVAVNIKAETDYLRHRRQPSSYTPDFGTHPRDGEKILFNSRFISPGHLRRRAGILEYDLSPTEIAGIILPAKYSASMDKLHKFEKSATLPSNVIEAIKGLDVAISSNIENFQDLLNGALKKSPDYFLYHDDINSPYFHMLDKMYLDHRIFLEPKADVVIKAIRTSLDVD